MNYLVEFVMLVFRLVLVKDIAQETTLLVFLFGFVVAAMKDWEMFLLLNVCWVVFADW